MATSRSNHSDDSFGKWSIGPYTSDDQPSADTPINAWSAVDEAQRKQPEPYRPAPYVPGLQAGPAVVPRNDNKGLAIAVIALAPAAVALLVDTMAYFYLSDLKGVNSADSSSSQSVRFAGAEDFLIPSVAKQKRRTEGFQPPSNWRHCSGPEDPDDLNLVYVEDVGDNTTTCQFATNVRNFFVERYRLTRRLSGTVTASNPTTGKTYTMTCRDDGRIVTCIDGTNTTAYTI